MKELINKYIFNLSEWNFKFNRQSEDSKNFQGFLFEICVQLSFEYNLATQGNLKVWFSTQMSGGLVN